MGTQFPLVRSWQQEGEWEAQQMVRVLFLVLVGGLGASGLPGALGRILSGVCGEERVHV